MLRLLFLLLGLAWVALSPGAALGSAASAIEYYHAGYGHYFVTAVPDEIAALDEGRISGWARTGESFGVLTPGTPGAANVCRFWSGDTFAPKSSHFYTPDPSECETVKRNPDWVFEGERHAQMLPDADGNCAGGLMPLYRLYNDGMGGAPNHRYTTSWATRSAMIAQGWRAEGSGIGVIGCVSPSAPPEDGAQDVDVVVVGAGASGVSAAMQAARLGMRVVLIEETDWLGGQLTAAAVSTIDGFVPMPQLFAERGGIFREFIGRLRAHYGSKPIGTCYWDNQHECFEPHVGQRILAQMIAEHSPGRAPGSITPHFRRKVTSVLKSGNLVKGVRTSSPAGPDVEFNSRIVIDATEYGDVLAKAGARYRVGNRLSTDSDAAKHGACVQDITYVAVLRRYPRSHPSIPGSGVPAGLLLNAQQVPDSDEDAATQGGLYRYDSVARYLGLAYSPTGTACFHYPTLWGCTENASGRCWQNPYGMGVLVGYRALPDGRGASYVGSTGYDLDGACRRPNALDAISRTALNMANDFPSQSLYYGLQVNARLSARYVEDEAYRKEMNCRAKLKTIQLIYFIQNRTSVGGRLLGMAEPDWAPAIDEGFDTPYNANENLCPEHLIPAPFKTIERHLALIPYVRESRRMIGVRTLAADDIVRSRHGTEPYMRSEGNERTAIAVGDYPMDVHNCDGDGDLETDLERWPDDPSTYSGRIGPFQVPVEVLIPETVDGLLAAEKNISVSRLVNGAIRLQPIAMMVGQAAGVVAARSIQRNVQPRALVYAGGRVDMDEVARIQRLLLLAGVPISPFRFSDVANTDQGTDAYWRYAQMASAHGWMTGRGNGDFGHSSPLTRAESALTMARRFGLNTTPPPFPAPPVFTDVTTNDAYRAAIESTYAAGITEACSGAPGQLRFCPDAPTSREGFVRMLVSGTGYEPGEVGGTQIFDDVRDCRDGTSCNGSYDQVQVSFHRGYTAGCSVDPRRFCPLDATTGAQAAAFLSRSLFAADEPF